MQTRQAGNGYPMVTRLGLCQLSALSSVTPGRNLSIHSDRRVTRPGSWQPAASGSLWTLLEGGNTVLRRPPQGRGIEHCAAERGANCAGLKGE